MKKKIFITGVSSEIILSLIDRINMDEYEIYGLTRNPENINSNGKVTLIKGDIQNINTIEVYLKECSVIIHAAAVTHSFNEKKYFNINLKATKELVKMATQCGITKFIFISSNTAGKKSGAYGVTKFFAEKYIENNFQKWLILRPAEVYGGNKKEGVEKFISGIIDNPMSLYPAGVPTKLYPIHLDDLADIIYNVVFEEEITNEKITICGPTGYSFPEIIRVIKFFKDKHIPTIPMSKHLMFIIAKITRWVPFYVGIIPDQIPRLYSTKNNGTTKFLRGKRTLETYLKERITSEAGS
ncbi:hypothetical protein GCM10007103_09200 [Salinimicrobium marinum]|uniref:NAD-dependent epimerase/dehydratase domain-containing protein n=1 Tax=Salinimicrobium marinum TaxID=680283 RepID=A0A918VWH6_9FLAO|nr:NAD-dependent epimerase/dehydratase family protein [Salinimicrobium marinum]GHA30070.1 hypothetical protein GCM10007103_09200 [Salinimicrobium marinum]